MKTIYKYEFPIQDHFSLSLPEGAEILHVSETNEQNGVVAFTVRGAMWCFVDNEKPVRQRHFELRGTGHDCEALDPLYFIRTFMMVGGSLVFHLFSAEVPATTPARAYTLR